MRTGGLVALLVLVILAACLQATPPPAADPIPEPPIKLTDDQDRWDGPVACADACGTPFSAHADVSDYLAALVTWDGTHVAPLFGRLLLPNGSVVEAQKGFDALRIRLPQPPAGLYVLQLEGRGNVTVSLRLDFGQPDTPLPNLLPNLVTLVPRPQNPVGPCNPTEELEQGAKRCLRLDNAVGNMGLGPLEVRLGLVEGATAELGQSRFLQRIYQTGGEFQDVQVGTADIHPTHAHFHYAGLAGFQLYEYDEITRLRGEAVSTMKKSGFCFIDIGLMSQDEIPAGPHRYGFEGCFVPDPTQWLMGVSVGWYDEYTAGLDEQYVEVSNVPDGTYVLVSTADATNTLVESDDSDNSAGVIVRLQGDHVEVVEPLGFYT